jgi:hypothetical protein
MRSLTVFLVVGALCACPAPSRNDSGAGGGTGGGFGGGSGATGGGFAVLTLDNYCAFLAGDGSCELAVACGLYTDATSCSTHLASQVGVQEELCGVARIAVDAGIVRFDSHAAAQCQSSYGTCGDAQAACSLVLVGVGDNGDDCDSRTPCRPGFYCASNGTCPGQCTPQKPGGASVYASVACADSTYARPEADGGFHYVCTARIALGHACTSVSSCVDGTKCDAMGICSPPGPANTLCGTPAQFSPFCGPLLSLACQPQLDGGAARCGARARRGEPCGFCVGDLRCVTDGGAFGVCGDFAQQGESCASAADCVDQTLTCEGGHCVTLPTEGGSCDDSFRCSVGLACHGTFVADGGYESRCEFYDAGTPTPSCFNTESP